MTTEDLINAVAWEDYTTAERLVYNGVNINLTVLIRAFDINRLDFVEFLLGNCTNLITQDNNGNTILMELSRYSCARYYAVGKIMLLLKYINVDELINKSNIHGDTALHIALRHGTIDSIDILLKNGADINMKNTHGDTPLICAILSKNLLFAIYLIKCGADTDLQNIDGDTALTIAIRMKCRKITRILMQYGSYIPIKYYYKKK